MSAEAVFSPNAPKPPPFLSQALTFGNLGPLLIEHHDNLNDFPEARTCVGVAELPLGTDIEIECTATKQPSANSHL
ncbi:hypothetical protein LA080_007324 [Diaporthe eres]|nr:hypothetical protein LA080_007324 [Diaporthe eres]